MNRLSLKDNQLKFKTSRELPITLEESIEEYTSNSYRKNRRMSTTCNRLDLQTLGSQVLNRLLCAKIFPVTGPDTAPKKEASHSFCPGVNYELVGGVTGQGLFVRWRHQAQL